MKTTFSSQGGKLFHDGIHVPMGRMTFRHPFHRALRPFFSEVIEVPYYQPTYVGELFEIALPMDGVISIFVWDGFLYWSLNGGPWQATRTLNVTV